MLFLNVIWRKLKQILLRFCLKSRMNFFFIRWMGRFDFTWIVTPCTLISVKILCLLFFDFTSQSLYKPTIATDDTRVCREDKHDNIFWCIHSSNIYRVTTVCEICHILPSVLKKSIYFYTQKNEIIKNSL